MSTVQLLGPDGQALPRAPKGMRPIRRGMNAAAYTAGDAYAQDLTSWNAPHVSPDAAYLPERKRITDRLHDLVRNNGWASGAVTARVNAAIGVGLRFNAAPDYRALGIDQDAAFDLGRQIEGVFRQWANDPRRGCDLTMRQDFGGLLRLLFRHRIVDGEGLAVLHYRPRRYGVPFATTLQVVHPARLSNPNDAPDQDDLRDGVETDPDGAPIGYYIRARHPGDRLQMDVDLYSWERLERATPWGRPVVIHAFSPEEAGQTRGVSPLAAVVPRLKMNDAYERAELQAAVANAVLAAFIETSMAPEEAIGLLDDGDKYADQNNLRASFYESAPVTLNGFRVPILPTGDRVNFGTPARPNREASDFVHASLRNLAAALGDNPSTISKDYSKTNYSSERAALVQTWRSIATERHLMAADVGVPVLLALLEEAIDSGKLLLPKGAPDLWEAPAAYTAGSWLGPGKGWVDPVKEAQGAQLRMQAGLSDPFAEAAEQGHDYEEILMRQKQAAEMRDSLGLPEPAAASPSPRPPNEEPPPEQREPARGGGQEE